LPQVRRELVGLQIIDFLLRVERPPSHIAVDLREMNKFHIRGVETELCASGPQAGFPGLPPVIDEDMADRIERLADNPEELAPLLGGMDEAAGRLDRLRRHVAALRQNRAILPPDKWASPEADRLLAQGDNYVARVRNLPAWVAQELAAAQMQDEGV
jgi:hypothetical protein